MLFHHFQKKDRGSGFSRECFSTIFKRKTVGAALAANAFPPFSKERPWERL
jgi:hypothetical protein